MRSDPSVLPAPAALPDLDPLATLAGQPAAFVPPAEAVLAQAEHRASIRADRVRLDSAAGPRPLPAAPVAELAPAPPLQEAERLDYQARLANLERFSTGLASLVDTQAHALWAANARLSALEPGSLPLASWVDAAAARPPVVWPGHGCPASAALRQDPVAASLPGIDSSSLRDSALPAHAGRSAGSKRYSSLGQHAHRRRQTSPPKRRSSFLAAVSLRLRHRLPVGPSPAKPPRTDLARPAYPPGAAPSRRA